MIENTYFITFRTYNSWLHGDSRGSVDPRHNVFTTPTIKSNAGLQARMQRNSKQPPFILDASQRSVVLKSLRDACDHAGWDLYAAHVRSNHVHVIIKASRVARQVAAYLKARATKCLQEVDLSGRKKYWSRGQSGKYIVDETGLFRSMQYVIEEQGERMALYYDREFYEVWG